MKGKAITVILILCGLLGCSVKKTSEPVTGPVEKEVNELPNMTITLLDSSQLDAKSLQGPTILIFFQPECDHCQRAAQTISQNIVAFAKTQLYFITSQPLQLSEKFANDYKLTGYTNVHFSQAPLDQVLNNYGPISAPSVYIYSAERRLIKSFNGEVAIDELLKYI